VRGTSGGRSARIRENNAEDNKENMRMRRVTGQSQYLKVAVMLGLVGILALGGCSKKNVMATTEGAGNTEAGAGATTEAGAGGGGSAPLQGFSQSPSEEAVKRQAPLVGKADTAEIAARQAREALKRALGDVYFEFDRWALTNEGKKNLTENAAALKLNSSVKILIEGHCDERGSREYNLVLGEKRALETRRYLESLGVKNPVTVTSYGKERPVCAEHDESCYWKNRRAHMVVEEGK
jgi:peptidoglycan-associated lipoprotein